MYPIFRFVTELVRHRNAPPLGLLEEHRAEHICWPWDIDPWMELNNGRILTLYDLGRVVLFQRIGVVRAMRENRWVGTNAGASVRYRRRLRAFQRYEMRSRIIGWDARFIYAEQGMWRKGTCASHALIRMAAASENGIVPTAELAAALGVDPQSPPLPAWVAAWIAADAERPWPPMEDLPAAWTGQDASIEAEQKAG
ncbi:MAG: acyl-CoA thioesterase [Pseudomonadota bacterium]